MDELDSRVRLAAFQFLAEQAVLHPDTLPYAVLQRGFDFEGRRVPLLGPQGIFKPAILPDMPLSIYTAPVVEGRPRPYEDEVRSDVILYRYRGSDPQHRDNAGLRLVMQRRIPLVYLHGIVPGQYVAAWPVYVVADDRGGGAAALWLAAILWLAPLPALGIFRALQRRWSSIHAA